MSNATLLIIVLVAVAIVVALVVFFVYRRRQQERRESARQEYGPEFERIARERGSEREAEQELRERRERIESEVQPLSEESRERYDEQWRQVEQTFVDDPQASLDDADRVVAQMLAERNFPTDSRQEASEGIGAAHPGVHPRLRGRGGSGQDAPGYPEIPLGVRAPEGGLNVHYLVKLDTQRSASMEPMADRGEVYVSPEGDRGWVILESEDEESLRRDLENSKSRFVDDPSEALAEARRAVGQALEARDYPPPERANEATGSRQEVLQEYQDTDTGDPGSLEDTRGAFDRLSNVLDRLTRT